MPTIRSKAQRTGILVTALAGAAILYGGARTTGHQDPAQMTAEATTIGAAGPVTLSNEPTQVVLEAKNLASRVETITPNQRIYLVLRELRAEAQPETLYHVYLDLPHGSKPEKGDPHDVGILNFYNAVPLEGGATSRGLFQSFDVTKLLKNLQQRNALADRITVTIVPSGVPAAGAKASIGRIEIVEQ